MGEINILMVVFFFGFFIVFFLVVYSKKLGYREFIDLVYLDGFFEFRVGRRRG